MKTFPILCELCQTQLGEAKFPDDQPDEDCIARTTHGYMCEECFNQNYKVPEQPLE